MKPKLVVKDDVGEAPATEVLVDQIKIIAEGVRKLRQGRLNDRALFLLVQQAAPSIGAYPPKKIAINTIRAVFEGIESLDQTFLRKTQSD